MCFWSQGALGLVPKLTAALQLRQGSGDSGGGRGSGGLGLENSLQDEEQGRGQSGGRERLRGAIVLAAGHLTGKASAPL